jgi:uncharacterized protein YbaA (DUF1428 family)
MAKEKGTYVDGFVLVVPKKNLRAYRLMARQAGKIWMRHGALAYVECVGDDLKTSWGLPFPAMAKAKRNEVVVFSYVVYRSRAHRDQVNNKVMQDPLMRDPKLKDKPMPFDEKRMAYGGFKVIVDASRP